MQGRDRDGDKQADRQAGSKVAGPAQDPSPQLSVRKGSCAFTPSVRPLPDKSLSDRSDKPALPRRAFTPRCQARRDALLRPTQQQLVCGQHQTAPLGSGVDPRVRGCAIAPRSQCAPSFLAAAAILHFSDAWRLHAAASEPCSRRPDPAVRLLVVVEGGEPQSAGKGAVRRAAAAGRRPRTRGAGLGCSSCEATPTADEGARSLLQDRLQVPCHGIKAGWLQPDTLARLEAVVANTAFASLWSSALESTPQPGRSSPGHGPGDSSPPWSHCRRQCRRSRRTLQLSGRWCAVPPSAGRPLGRTHARSDWRGSHSGLAGRRFGRGLIRIDELNEELTGNPRHHHQIHDITAQFDRCQVQVYRANIHAD